MALPSIISRNNIQKTNKRIIPMTNDVVQPTTWYTCPTGKVAVIKGNCTCVDTGAAATVALNGNDIILFEWTASGGGTPLQNPRDILEGLWVDFEIDLNAGETMTTTQNTGTNAQIKLQAVIEEFIV